jgi:hypothetical protein
MAPPATTLRFARPTSKQRGREPAALTLLRAARLFPADRPISSRYKEFGVYANPKLL